MVFKLLVLVLPTNSYLRVGDTDIIWLTHSLGEAPQTQCQDGQSP